MSQSAKGPVKPVVILVLQGGGALGAYHIGAYQALSECGFDPHWFCGISIGAVNAAILAGNEPKRRLARLQDFWHRVSWPELFPPFGNGAVRSFFNAASFAQALTFGQPSFFAPRLVSPFIAPSTSPDRVSFYDTSPLRQTLGRFVDFDRINGRQVQLSLGVTDVESGEFSFFENFGPDSQQIGPEHVVASGSLPPGFPATRIGEHYYWDGGCVSNTALDAVVKTEPSGHSIAFVIDLWDATGPQPRTLSDVLWRQKQIQYATRTAHHIESITTKINLRHALKLLKRAKVPEAANALPAVTDVSTENRLDIVHIIYHPDADQIPNSDAEFSRTSIEDRRAAGHRDMRRAIEAEPWYREERPAHLGALVHRVTRWGVVTLSEQSFDKSSGQPATATERSYPLQNAPARSDEGANA